MQKLSLCLFFFFVQRAQSMNPMLECTKADNELIDLTSKTEEPSTAIFHLACKDDLANNAELTAESGEKLLSNAPESYVKSLCAASQACASYVESVAKSRFPDCLVNRNGVQVNLNDRAFSMDAYCSGRLYTPRQSKEYYYIPQQPKGTTPTSSQTKANAGVTTAAVPTNSSPNGLHTPISTIAFTISLVAWTVLAHLYLF